MENQNLTEQALINTLKEGTSIKIRGIRIGFENDNSIFVTGWTNFNDLQFLNKLISTQELFEIKETFIHICTEYPSIEKLFVNKEIKFNLCFDYGMGAIPIVEEVNGNLIWQTSIND